MLHSSALCFSVQAFTSSVQFDAAPGEGFRNVFNDFGPAVKDVVKSVLINSITFDIRQGDDSSRARLTGHHAHLAKEIAGVQVRHALAEIAVNRYPHFGITLL